MLFKGRFHVSCRRIVQCMTVFLVVFTLLAGGASAGTLYYYASDGGDYIGQGESRLYGLSNATFTPTLWRNYNSDIYGWEITVETIDGSEWWYITFDAPGDELLVPGTYSNAIRWPFNDNSTGLDVSGCGRGCNQLSGSFEIFELTYTADNTSIETFAAQFIQHCENDAPALRGVVEYNSVNEYLPTTTTSLAATTTTSTMVTTTIQPATTTIQPTTTTVHAATTTTVAPACTDADGDGYGTGAACAKTQDCNDADPDVYPGAKEVCGDDIDNNCDGQTDEDCSNNTCPAAKLLGEDSPRLADLRFFRDNTLAKSPLGRKIITLYYRNAGSIDTALESSPALRSTARSVLEAVALRLGR